jgi:anti-anti-sigma factor
MHPPDFSVTVGRHDDVVRVVVEGELDLFSAPVLAEHLDTVAGDGAGRVVVLDFEHLTFLDSSGIALLLGVARRAAREGWTLSIVGTPTQALSVLDTCGLLDVLPLAAG